MEKQLSFLNNYSHYKLPATQYLGSKTKLVNWIGYYIPPATKNVLDAFSGSQAVSYFFKQKGFRVYTNDFLKFNYNIGLSLIENHSITLDKNDLEILFSENKDNQYFSLMQNLFTDIFFTEEECNFLDAFRSNIDDLNSETKKALALTIMCRSMTRKVTMGHFAHTKALEYARNEARIKRNRSLVRPIKDIFMDFLPAYNSAIFCNNENNKSFNEDATVLVDNFDDIDLLYLDPPYCNSHADYQSFYHLLETYVEYWKDKQFINGTKRYSPKKVSGYDSKKEILKSFTRLFENAQKIKYWLISYNDRSFPDMETMVQLLSKYKNVKTEYKEYTNSVGGKGSVKGSKELLFVCT